MTNESESPSRKNRIAINATVMTVGFAMPMLLVVALVPNFESLNILDLLEAAYASIAFSAVALVIITFIVQYAIEKSGDPDNMLRWSRTPQALIPNMMIFGATFSIMITSAIASVSEPDQVLTNIIQSILIALIIGAVLLWIGMWFSHKDNQKLHEKLDRIENKLSSITVDSKTPTDEFGKDGQNKDAG